MDIDNPDDQKILREFWGAKEDDIVHGLRARSVYWHKWLIKKFKV
jgi:hypothetical protein